MATAQKDQKDKVYKTYLTAQTADVSYMGTTFQADADSQSILNHAITALNGSVPEGFYWVDVANNKVSMTFVQLQGLASAMMTQGWSAFQELQAKKATIDASTTIVEVQAVV